MPDISYQRNAILTFQLEGSDESSVSEGMTFTSKSEGEIKNNGLIIVANFDDLQLISDDLENAIALFFNELKKINGLQDVQAEWGENEPYSFSDSIEKGIAWRIGQNKSNEIAKQKTEAKQSKAFEAWQQYQNSILTGSPIYLNQEDFIYKEIVDKNLAGKRMAEYWLACWKKGSPYPCTEY